MFREIEEEHSKKRGKVLKKAKRRTRLRKTPFLSGIGGR
jgi:hypothetical protein